jgi:radical SAM superfamily enzyme
MQSKVMSVQACSEFGCDGCVNRDGMAGVSMGCGWCPKAGPGDTEEKKQRKKILFLFSHNNCM